LIVSENKNRGSFEKNLSGFAKPGRQNGNESYNQDSAILTTVTARVDAGTTVLDLAKDPEVPFTF